MVNIKTLTFAALATFASMAAADLCTNDRLYCGAELMSIGDYVGDIEEALDAASEPINDVTRANGLFRCANDDSGNIAWESTCEACKDGGDEDDYC